MVVTSSVLAEDWGNSQPTSQGFRTLRLTTVALQVRGEGEQLLFEGSRYSKLTLPWAMLNSFSWKSTTKGTVPADSLALIEDPDASQSEKQDDLWSRVRKGVAVRMASAVTFEPFLTGYQARNLVDPTTTFWGSMRKQLSSQGRRHSRRMLPVTVGRALVWAPRIGVMAAVGDLCRDEGGRDYIYAPFVQAAALVACDLVSKSPLEVWKAELAGTGPMSWRNLSLLPSRLYRRPDLIATKSSIAWISYFGASFIVGRGVRWNRGNEGLTLEDQWVKAIGTGTVCTGLSMWAAPLSVTITNMFKPGSKYKAEGVWSAVREVAKDMGKAHNWKNRWVMGFTVFARSTIFEGIRVLFGI